MDCDRCARVAGAISTEENPVADAGVDTVSMVEDTNVVDTLTSGRSTLDDRPLTKAIFLTCTREEHNTSFSESRPIYRQRSSTPSETEFRIGVRQSRERSVCETRHVEEIMTVRSDAQSLWHQSTNG